MRKVTVILNAAFGHHDAQQAADDIRAGFAEAGCECRLVVVQGAQEVTAQARKAVEAARAWRGSPARSMVSATPTMPDDAPAMPDDAPATPDDAPAMPDDSPVVAAAGGDGTICLMAALVLQSGVTFGLIPLGTFNFLARNLGIPLEPRAAARALATGVTRRIPVGRVNGHLFLNNASLGLYRQLLEEREGYKRRFGRYQIVAAFAAVATLLRFSKRYTLRLDLDGRPVAIHTPMLFFGLNSLQFEKLGMDAARCTQAGMMAVVVLQPVGFWKLFGLALRGALHRLHDSPDLRTHCASQAQVLLPGRRRMRVAVDGEGIECKLPLHFEVLPEALPVVVPREPEERR